MKSIINQYKTHGHRPRTNCVSMPNFNLGRFIVSEQSLAEKKQRYQSSTKQNNSFGKQQSN